MKSRREVLSSLLLVAAACLLLSGCRKSAPIRSSIAQVDVVRSNELFQEGEAAFNRKEYYAALIKYLEASGLNPDNEYLQNRMGMTYSQLKLYSEAIAAYQRSIALNPRYPYPVNNLGTVYFAQSRMRKARTLFRKALQMKGDEASFHLNLAMVYLQKNKVKEAMKHLRTALDLNPGAVSGQSLNLAGGGKTKTDRNYIIARLHALEGRVEPAIENLRKAIANGFTAIEDLQKQPDFNPIRKDKRFAAFMAELPLLIQR